MALPVACLVSGPALYAQNNYVSYELIRENNWAPLITEDVNGDGGKDLIFSHYQPGIGRELHIHHQQGDGNFASSPQRVEIKTEIIAVGFADLRPDPGMELLLLADSGVFSLSTVIDGYTGNIKQLLSWDLIAAVPDLERVRFFNGVTDINGDGLADLLLPGDNGYGYFAGKAGEEFELISTFTTINENLTVAQRNAGETDLDARIAINSDEGIVLELSAERTTPFAGFIEDWTQRDKRRSLLRSDRWMPAALLADIDDDRLKDVVYLNVGDDGLGQINIHYQQPDTGFREIPDWTGSLDTRGSIQLADMNGDGRTDLLRLDGDGNEWNAHFFLNHGGSFSFDQPTQIMRFSGYDTRLSFVALEPDRPPLLNVNYYTIPVVEAIRNAGINRTQLLYGSDEVEPGQLFNRRPDARLEESFSAASVRGLSEQMSLQYDVDGDGRNDALYVTANGTLAAKRITADLQIAGDPFWEYVSPRNVFQFEVLALNRDAGPDLLLRHGATTTLLVATP